MTYLPSRWHVFRWLKFHWLLLACLLPGVSALHAQQQQPAEPTYTTVTNIAYRSGEQLSDYQKSQCRLDVYYPDNSPGYSTVVWFHGGGLKGGKRSVPAGLQQQGVAVVAVSYRLHPRVQAPAYIEDAAAAVAWTMEHIGDYGGDPARVFVSGHSAGGYLTSMVGLDKRWLAAHGKDPDDLAGLIPYSGHTITHFTVRKERGIDGKQPIVDDLAPLFHVRADCPPILFVTGDRELEMLGRYEENAYMWRMMQVVEHPDAELYELDGYNHGKMAEPAHPLLLRFVKRISHQASVKADSARHCAGRWPVASSADALGVGPPFFEPFARRGRGQSALLPVAE